MKTYPYRVAGDATTTNFVESDEDLDLFQIWLWDHSKDVLGLDTETTGLDIFSPDFACRLVQVGTTTEAWVIPAAQFHGRLRATFTQEIKAGRRWVAHNAPFDLLVLDRVGLADLDDLAPLVYDTRVLAHLLDPRSAAEGGTGHGLKALSAIYVDPDAPDTAEGLTQVFRKEYGATKASGLGWKRIDLDHPTYVLYAGLDVLLVTRLLQRLSPLIRGNNLSALAQFESRVLLAGCRMQRRGMLLDVPYTERLVDRLTEEETRFLQVAQTFDWERTVKDKKTKEIIGTEIESLSNVNSVIQVRSALLLLGEVWKDRTDSGQLAVGKETLLPMADLDAHWERLNTREPNELADAILRAKRAAKWRESYALAFLNGRDADNRVHPSLNMLAARTARMSISNPPLQQLPASDSTIRSAFIADPGMSIISADFAQIEMRVLAALADVKEMKRAISAGESLHKFTANLLFGPGYPEWKYKVAKNTGFARVYGGGVGRIAKTSGVDDEVAREVVDAYDRAFPEIATYGKTLQRAAMLNGGFLFTPSGRMLPMDRDRSYAATNHVIQASARDIMAEALLRIEDAGLGEHLLIPIHDEVLAQAPTEDADEVIHEIARAMETTLNGVFIAAEGEVYGPSWGDGYK